MRRLILLFWVAIFGFSALAQEMNVASFNIRVGHPARANGVRKADYKKFNGWDDRKEYLCDMINFESFDIFGAQEVLKRQLDDMVEMLPDYKYIGCGSADGKDKSEFCPIFYRKSKYKLLDEGHFWLSDTPDVPSKGWGSKYYRVCTWGLFQNRKTKELFYFINTHFSWHEAAVNSAKQIVAFVNEKCIKSSNVIITGDFNSTQTSKPYKIFIENGFADTYDIAKYRFAPTGTGHGFRPYYFTERRIDHIFVSKGIEASRYGVLTYHYFRNMDGEEKDMDTAAPKEIKGEDRDIKCISDHYAVQSFITLKKAR